jgi:hypothetical protein
MRYINVKTVAGRVAFDSPRGGKRIPTDKFVSVPETNYIRRLIDIHGDLTEEGGKAKPATPAPAAKPPSAT